MKLKIILFTVLSTILLSSCGELTNQALGSVLGYDDRSVGVYTNATGKQTLSDNSIDLSEATGQITAHDTIKATDDINIKHGINDTTIVVLSVFDLFFVILAGYVFGRIIPSKQQEEKINELNNVLDKYQMKFGEL